MNLVGHRDFDMSEATIIYNESGINEASVNVGDPTLRSITHLSLLSLLPANHLQNNTMHADMPTPVW